MQTDRLLSIILILMNKGTVTGRELAEHFEVSLRTIYRDIDKISRTMVPIASMGGKGGGFYILDNYKLDKMLFSRAEIKPLLTLMRSLKDMLGKNKSFNNCITKFENFYSDEYGDSTISIDMSEIGGSSKTGDFIDALNKAIENSRCVVIDYTNRRLESSERVVEPLRIYFFDGSWYFAGFCRERNDFRQFKISRIRSLIVTEPFLKRNVSPEDLDIIFSHSFREKSVKVTLRFSNRMVNHLNEHFSEDKIIINYDGTAHVTFHSPNEEGLLKYILGFGIDCEVIEPPSLRSELTDYIEQLLLFY
jgi:predicted DNA-binding transcriptional regulator YafY